MSYGDSAQKSCKSLSQKWGCARSKDSPMTTFAGQCRGWRRRAGRTLVTPASVLVLRPRLRPQWWPVVSGSRSQPHTGAKQLTCAALASLATRTRQQTRPWAKYCDTANREIRILLQTWPVFAELSKHVLKNKSLKDWKLFLTTWWWLSPPWCYQRNILSSLFPTY